MLNKLIFEARFYALIFIVLVNLPIWQTAKSNKNFIEEISDVKEFKKILRVHTNVMILYYKSAKDVNKIMKVYKEVAEQVKGLGLLAVVDCGSDGKKVCKKQKIVANPFVLKHYKDREFNKDYDRQIAVQAMVKFMKDPTGDLPWEDDESARDVIHIMDPNALNKMLRSEKRPFLLMFYAPWCGFCKRLKPDYAAAATELRGKSILAAFDVSQPENSIVRRHFNISGIPTLIYFENGNVKYTYDGEKTKDDIVQFMKNPGKMPEAPKEENWSEIESDVVHLSDSSFDSFIQANPSVLIMFYAPWCGHCKAMKPAYMDAAFKMKETKVKGVLAAVDTTKEKALGEKFKIQGYPTVKYFKNGEFAFDVDVRTGDKILEFMNDPKEPPPPPAPEKHWSEIESDVVHLEEETFKPFLKKKKHVLVMFYAPWCGHCKKAKPEFQNAASKFSDDPKVEFAAVDCTLHSSVCSAYDVKGYPSIKYFNYFKNSKPYEGGRSEEDFISFMKDPQNPLSTAPPVPPTPEEQWSTISGAEHIQHLTDLNFNDVIAKEESVLVMFYAPWCGHCKAMKPAYGQASAQLAKEKVSGVLSAVDATIEKETTKKYDIRGFPTLKYFRNGKLISEYEKGRSAKDLVSFMKNPPQSKDEL